MRTLRKTIMIMAMLLLSIASFAIPANKKPVTVVQPNGKTLTFILQGDERVNWAETLDGYSLLLNKNGNRVYAILDEYNNMVASNVLACNVEQRSQEEIDFLSTITPGLRFSKEQVKMKKEAFAELSGMNQEGRTSKYPTTGVDSLLVILVDFTDLPFTFSNQNYVDMMGQSNYHGTGSVKDYYLQQSDSTFEMAIRVVGPYTLPNNMAYYGGHTVRNGVERHDKNMTYFVRDAINAADPDVDYSHYDNDNDGKVDGIHIIFAGTPESSTGNPDEIWPHRGEVNSSIQKDGVRFTAYSCSAEKRTSTMMDNIGTICHEFGHVLGLPDNYDTDYDGTNGTAVTTQTWDLMAEGPYNNDAATPPYWTAGEKIITNWISKVDTLDVNTSLDSLRISTISGKKDTAYYIPISENEFYLIEARRKVGWDAYIPGEGVLVYHGQIDKINNWINNGSNTINVNPNDRGWFIEPADGIIGHVNTGYASFPGTGLVPYFTQTSPNPTQLVNGTAVTNVALTDIHRINDSTYMFNFNSALPMVSTTGGTNIDLNSFDVSGKILYQGSGTLLSKGVMWSENEDFNAEGYNISCDDNLSDDQNINVSLTDLQRGTTYYYRAFAISSTGTGLGDVKYTETLTGFGNVTTQSAQVLSDSSSVTLRGNFTYVGMADFVAKGFVYTTDPNELPTIENSEVISMTESNTGAFSYILANLPQGVTYYYRAFITNEFGTAYGMRQSFTTLYPAITNNTISSNQQLCQGVAPSMITGTTPQGGFGNFTYLWQQKTNYTNWEDAEGVNDQLNYQPSLLTDSTYFRRVTYSDNRVSANSNSVLVAMLSSRGGYILADEDTMLVNRSQELELRGNVGSIIDWQMSSDNGDNFVSLNTTSNPYLFNATTEGEFIFKTIVQISTCPEATSGYKTIVVKSNSSINDVENTINFSVMPNPSTNGTFVITSEINDGNIVISNVLGQKVYEQNNIDLRNKEINLDVENGSYIINITSDGNTHTEKLIINR